MITLAAKGDSVIVAPGFKRLTATMTYAKSSDFDLAAWFVAHDGRSGLVYYGNIEMRDEQDFVQSLTTFPFMRLSSIGKSNAQDITGKKKELVIASLDAFKDVYLIVWDDAALTGVSRDGRGVTAKGSPTRFEGSNLAITITDDRGLEYRTTFEPDKDAVVQKANISLLAFLSNSRSETRLINSSYTELWNGVHDTRQFVDLVQHADDALSVW